MKKISVHDVIDISIGAAILGSGGGGNPRMGRLIAEHALEKYGPVDLISAEMLTDDAVIIPISFMGAPTVFHEKILSGNELPNVIAKAAQITGKHPTHLMNCEIGGINATAAIAPAARLGLPVVDGDLISRAFPEIQMVLLNPEGIPMSPLVIADDKNNIVTMDVINHAWGETISRALVNKMGGVGAIALPALSGKTLRQVISKGTMSKAKSIGQTIRKAREQHEDLIDAICTELSGNNIFSGKVIDVERRLSDGFIRGSIIIEKNMNHFLKQMKIDFQNEYLIASIDGETIVTTPDLISVVEKTTGEALPADTIHYGCDVAVISSKADKRWYSKKGLAIVGPEYFGYSCKYGDAR